jgi:hypothetical protein
MINLLQAGRGLISTRCRRLRWAAFGHQETYSNHFRMPGISLIHASATTQVQWHFFSNALTGKCPCSLQRGRSVAQLME